MNPSRSQVAVLLCTYNGQRYLKDQLDSIARQDMHGWRLYVSDDGSADDTRDIVERWRQTANGSCMPLRQGPARGHAANFLSLVTASDVEGDFYAYADQDDVWDRDKLSRAVRVLSSLPETQPALYCSRTRSISAVGELRGESPMFSRPPSFANALLQNIAGGNTMVFNSAARNLLCRAGSVDVVSHDWWTYLLIAGAGGRVIYDPNPSLSYRQHDCNAIGDNSNARSRWKRYRSFLGGRNREWYARNIVALRENSSLLTEQSCGVLDRFESARDMGLPGRLLALVESGVYAQTMSGQLGLFTATLLKKI